MNLTSTSLRGDHGTSVAGLIAAVGWNGIGSRGVAPNAKFAGFNYLAQQSVEVEADQLSGNFDIFNQSYGTGQGEPGDGSPRFYVPATDTYKLQIRYGVNRLRNGKGAIYVRAAGNSFQDDLRDGQFVSRTSAADGSASLHQHVIVGALGATGVRSSYSSPGSNIWVASLGGEFGTDSPAMITVDQTGCDIGYSRTGVTKNAFEGGLLDLNANCTYASGFNGTSSATPVASGAIALILEANPNLTWRDVKHILAKTATQVDKDVEPQTHPLDPPGHIHEPAWTTNAAGFKFHNWYGFGRIDAEAAVKMARTYISKWKPQQEVATESAALNLAIPDFDKDGVESELTVQQDLKIEAVQIQVWITHPFTGDIGLELKSPSGTRSVILHTNNSFNQADFTGAIMLSNAFLDELSMGKWTLRVIDGRATNDGELTKWAINIIGRAP